MIMVAKIMDFVKAHFSDMVLFIVIVLLVMLAYAAGYITAKQWSREPIQVRQDK